MRREIQFLGIAGWLLLAIGCAMPEDHIADLDPYSRTPAETPRPLDAPRPQQPAPRQVAGGGERGWMPASGVSRRWKYVVVHHSGSDKSTPQGMRDWHMRGRGWDELGYHFVIGNGVRYGDGQVFVGARWNRQMHGAHCKTPDNLYNDHGIGICLIGDLDAHPPTAAQVKSLGRLLAFLTQQCGLPKSRVLTHGGITHKTACPGRYFALAPALRAMDSYAVAASSR